MYKKTTSVEVDSDDDEEDLGTLEYVQELLAATCHAATHRPSTTSGSEVPFRIDQVAGLTKWWKDWRAKKRKREGAIRRTALGKLTSEERKILGV